MVGLVGILNSTGMRVTLLSFSVCIQEMFKQILSKMMRGSLDISDHFNPCGLTITPEVAGAHCSFEQLAKPLLHEMDAKRFGTGKVGLPVLPGGEKCWIKPVNSAQGTTRFISSRNSRFRILSVTNSSSSEAKAVCFMKKCLSKAPR